MSRNPNHPPPRVEVEHCSPQDYEKPAEVSERCLWWLKRFEEGWRPSRRIGMMALTDSAEFFGITIWEYMNVIRPMERAFVEMDQDVAEVSA